MFLTPATAQSFPVPAKAGAFVTSASANFYNRTTGFAVDGFADNTGANGYVVSVSIAATTTLGPFYSVVQDAGGNIVGTVEGEIGVPGGTGLDAAGVRAAIGLAAANLDTQLAAIGPGLTAAGVRAAVGLAAANLDTQLAAIAALAAPAAIRAAIGMAAANLDAQLAAIGPGLDAAGVRAAIGLAAANLDAQIATLSTLNSAGIRAAIGMAAANMDAQLAAIGPGLTAAGVRAAVGLAAANLDTQIGTLAVPGSAMLLTGAGYIAAANALLDLADSIEIGHTVRQALRLNSAVQGGLVSLIAGGGVILGAGVATPRVTATVPGDGSRPAMVLNL